MNIKRKESAVNAFKAEKPENLAAALAASERGYTPDEIDEITEAIHAEWAKNRSNQDTNNGASQDAPAPAEPATPVYDEWTCAIKQQGPGKLPTVEKLKQVRKGVKMQPHQAEALNTGLVFGGNNYANLFFLPDETYPGLSPIYDGYQRP